MMDKSLFCNKKELLKMVKNCEGLSEITVEPDCIFAYDDYNGMDLRFHYIENRNYDELFNFGSVNVDKKKFYSVLDKYIDKLLFLMPVKVFFVSFAEEVEDIIDDISPECDFCLDMDNFLGRTWSMESSVFINVGLCKTMAIESPCVDRSAKCIFNEIIWTTLIHELRHLVCDFGVIIPDQMISVSEATEDAVEDYCNDVFFNDILCNTNEYLCFEL